MYLVNTAPGRIVDTDTLVEAMERGHVAGCAGGAWYSQPAPANPQCRNMPKHALKERAGYVRRLSGFQSPTSFIHAQASGHSIGLYISWAAHFIVSTFKDATSSGAASLRYKAMEGLR